MIRDAIDRGINYIDTAWSYHGATMGLKGESEPFVGRVLGGGYRKKVKLATKLPAWLVNSRKDMDYFLDSQLKRLQTDFIDFYLVHSLGEGTWRRMKKLGITDFLEKAQADGRIRFPGFSFHDQFDLFREITDAFDWSFCQIQYNYLDEGFQAGKAGLLYAAEKGMGIVGMEPLRGGKLAHSLPEEAAGLFRKSGIERSPAQWALRWVWNHPQISTVLSGMNEPEQVEQNISAADEGWPDSLTPGEMAIINQVKTVFGKKLMVNCTTCGYCMPCPSGVNIPINFTYYNDFHLFDSKTARETTTRLYRHFVKPGEEPSSCIECGQCEEKCPQGVAIISELKNVAKIFGD